MNMSVGNCFAYFFLMCNKSGGEGIQLIHEKVKGAIFESFFYLNEDCVVVLMRFI